MKTTLPYKLKSYKTEERAALPSTVRMLMFFAIKGMHIEPSLIEQAYELNPECFEPVNDFKKLE